MYFALACCYHHGWVKKETLTGETVLAEHGKLLKTFIGSCWFWKINVCCVIVKVSCGYSNYDASIDIDRGSTENAREGWKR